MPSAGLRRPASPVPLCDPEQIADLAVTAMRVEADLTPKPGLVDGRGRDAHSDMDLHMLHRSAEALRGPLTECARAATGDMTLTALRVRLGEIGRAGEATMLEATRGVNTHRGALWALGLLSAGAAAAHDVSGAVAVAAALARIPDAGGNSDSAITSHGARARRRYGVAGAAGQAAQGFPHVRHYGLPALRATRARGAGERTAQLNALVALIAHLDDTCLLHRGGRDGLRTVRRSAASVVRAGGCDTVLGRRRLARLDDLCRDRRLSPGGSGDLLCATVFLDALDQRRTRCSI